MDVSLSENVILGKQSSSKYSSKFRNIKFNQLQSVNSNTVIENFDVRTPGNKL